MHRLWHRLRQFWGLLHQRYQILMELFIILTIAGLMYVSLNLLHINHLAESLELITYDLRFLLPPLKPFTPNNTIVLVVFDDSTLAAYDRILGTWPWSRGIQADIIDYLENAHVKLIAYDMMFCSTGHDQQDARLIQAFHRYPNLYLGINLDYSDKSSANEPNESSALMGQAWPDITALAYPITLNSHYALPAVLVNPLLTFDHYRPLLPGLMAVRSRIGVLNHLRDPDGVSRGNPLLYQFQVRNKKQIQSFFLPYLGLRMVADLNHINLSKHPVELRANQLTYRNQSIPLRDDGLMLVNWRHYQAHPYKEISARLILHSIGRLKAGHPTEDDRALQQLLHNKIVFVGATAVSTYDIKTTAIQRLMPGVTFQATLFDNLLQGNAYIQRINNVQRVVITGLLCLLACFCLIKLRAAWQGLLLIAGLTMLYLISVYICFDWFGLWVDVVSPLMFFFGTVILTFTVKYTSREFDYVQTYRLATTDSLTGLFNHRYFQTHASRLIQLNKAPRTCFSLILIDIDHFKKFNDRLGHLIGDAVLRIVAQQLKNTVRNTDVVARYGGEEMVILLSRTPYAEAVQIAKKLVQTIGQSSYELDKHIKEHVTISAGVATFPEHGETTQALIAVADECLYFAKQNGRNQVGLPPPKAAELDSTHSGQV